MAFDPIRWISYLCRFLLEGLHHSLLDMLYPVVHPYGTQARGYVLVEFQVRVKQSEVTQKVGVIIRSPVGQFWLLG